MKTIARLLPGAALVCALSMSSVLHSANGDASASATPQRVEIKRVDVALFSRGESPTARLSSSEAPGREVSLGEVSRGESGRWDEILFKGKTSYKIISDVDKGSVLRAVSSNAASAIGKSIRINLTETPYLNWAWKIDNRLDRIDETSRGGDDFAARIYVVKRAGIFGRRSKAVNYVWSSNQSQGAAWDNAYKPDNSKMIAVRGVEDKINQWVVERRNVARDFLRLFGPEVESIDVLVIMTDTDNTGLSARASYGDIFFSSE